MIETNKRGDQKILDLIKALETFTWSEWEYLFIQNLKMRQFKYFELTTRQKDTVGDLWEKL